MPRIVIALTTEKAMKQWVRFQDLASAWIERFGDCPADGVTAFLNNVDSGEMSAYYADEPQSHIRVAAALALGRQDITSTGCIVFAEEILAETEIPYLKSEGETADRIANKWHLDLKEVTGTRLATLVTRLRPDTEEADYFTVYGAEAEAAIKAAAAKPNEIDRGLVKLGTKARARVGL